MEYSRLLPIKWVPSLQRRLQFARGQPKFQTRSPNGWLKFSGKLPVNEGHYKFPAHSALLKPKWKMLVIGRRQKNISAKIKVNRQLSTCFEIYLGSPKGSQKIFVGSSLEYIAFKFCWGPLTEENQTFTTIDQVKLMQIYFWNPITARFLIMRTFSYFISMEILSLRHPPLPCQTSL